MPDASPSDAAANACVRAQHDLRKQGKMPAKFAEEAVKLRVFFAFKTGVDNAKWARVTSYDDLEEHTGITAEDAKAAAVKPAEKLKNVEGDNDEVGGEAAAGEESGEWTLSRTVQHVIRNGETIDKSTTQKNVYESRMIYFEAFGELSPAVQESLDKAFQLFEQEAAAKEAAAAAKEVAAAAKPASGIKRKRNADAATEAAAEAAAAEPEDKAATEDKAAAAAAKAAAKAAEIAALSAQMKPLMERLAKLEQT